MQKSIEHYGLAERILQYGKDWSQEFEDVPNVGGPARGLTHPEEIISVGQQVFNVINAKNMSPSEKVLKLLNNTLNPFEKEYNFNRLQLRDSTTSEMSRMKFVDIANPKKAPSLQKFMHKGTNFLPRHQKEVDQIIKEAREDLDLPFDELYHRQKQVIQDVIDAEKALKEKMAALPDPAADMMLDLSKVSAKQRSEVQDVLDRLDSAFTVSQRRKKEAFLNEKLKRIQDDSKTGAYKFDYSETSDLKE